MMRLAVTAAAEAEERPRMRSVDVAAAVGESLRIARPRPFLPRLGSLPLLPLLLLLLAAALSLSPCAAAAVPKPSSPSSTITLGVVQYFNSLGSANLTGYEADAFELLAGIEAAVEAINADPSLLANYTLATDVRNSYYDQVHASFATLGLIDGHYAAHPVPLVLGLVGFDEAQAAAVESQPFQTPIISYFVSTPSLTVQFPNVARTVSTDTLEAFALLALFDAMGWARVSILYNSVSGSSSELADVITDYASRDGSGLSVQVTGYVYALNGHTPQLFSLSSQIAAIKASGNRVVLLSGFAADILPIMVQLSAAGLVGEPYTFVGSSQWCFDKTLYTDPVHGRLLDGVLCTSNRLQQDSPEYSAFQEVWKKRFDRDPALTYNLSAPKLSAAAFDAVYLAAHALDRLLSLRGECGLGPSGVPGGAPLSDLPGLGGPLLRDFHPYLYAAPYDTPTATQISFTLSTVPQTAPEACPWLASQVGQSRVLGQLVRSTSFRGATGLVELMPSGDRLGDIALNNIYAGEQKLVGVAGAKRMNPQLSSSSDLFNASGWGGAVVTDLTPSLFARDPPLKALVERLRANGSFAPILAYEQATVSLGLGAGRRFGVDAFSSLDLASIRFPSGTAVVPRDSALLTLRIEGVSPAARIAVWFFCCLVMVYIVGLTAFQLRYRSHRVVKMTSPLMNVTTLVGSFGIVIFVVLLAFDSGDVGESRFVQMCHEKVALLAISFSLAFGSLFAKTYRVDAIFNHKQLKVHVVRDRDILLMVAGLVGLDVILLVIWGAQSPMYRLLDSDSPVPNPQDRNELFVPSRDFCRSDNWFSYLAAMLVLKGAVLLLGLFLALRIRNVHIPNLNDSKFIVLSVYNVDVVSSMLVPVSLVTQNNADVFYCIVSFAMLFLVVSVLSLLFLPRMLTVCMQWDCGLERAKAGGGVAHHTPPVDASEMTHLRGEVTALKQRLTAVQHEAAASRKMLLAAGIEPPRLSTTPGTSTPGRLTPQQPTPRVLPAALATHHLQPATTRSVELTESPRAALDLPQAISPITTPRMSLQLLPRRASGPLDATAPSTSDDSSAEHMLAPKE